MKSDFLSLAVLSFKRQALRKIVFSRPVASDAPSKVSGRLCAHRDRRILALEYTLKDDTVAQKNLQEDSLEGELSQLLSQYRQINLITELGDAERKLAKDGREVLLGCDKLERKLSDEALPFERAIEALDKKKSYIFDGSEPFMSALGISDKTGRVHDKKQGKFRQINRFVEHISDVYDKLPGDGEVLVYDLCCGKSYLGFAVYHYLVNIKKRRVRMLGVDLKGETVKRCDGIARELGFSGMRFIADDIRNLPKGECPDLVLSLHACDIATDIVLDTAMELGAAVILSTPCCHRYLNDKVAAKELKFVSDYPHLRNKLCEALTDAIRLARLKTYGYKVWALELTDPDDTPKNTLLRAVKGTTAGGEIEKAKEEYERILQFVLGSGACDYLKECK